MTAPSNSLTEALLRETARLARDIEAARRFYLRWMIAGVLTVVCLVTGAVFQLRPAMPYEFTIIFVSLLLCLPLAQALNALFRRRGKALFVNGMAETAGLRYEPRGVFTLGEARRHKILPPYDAAEVEDGFEGTVHGVSVAFQEVRLSNLQPDPAAPRQTREYAAFHGMLIRIRLRRRLDSHTVVMPRAAFTTFFRRSFGEYQTVRLPAKFEQAFTTLSTDQVESRLILDPAFMERFAEALPLMRARWLEVSFCDNEILFAVQRLRPLFEVGHIWQPVTPEYLRKLADHIHALDRMIETLRLNRHTGLN